MKSSDITLTIFIILIFIALYLFNILSIGITKIENDWPTYRCNPVVMPFASVFGHDSVSNFTYCIQNMQSNYMNYLLQPVNYNLGVVGEIGSSITDALQSARLFISNLRNFIMSIVQNVFGVFLNILIEFMRVMIELRDMLGKTVGILATLMYTLDGSIKTTESVWNGAPGQAVRSLAGLCFHPETKVESQDGKVHKISELPLNTKLKNGAIVQSVMKISNVKENGEQREKMFKIKSDENKDCIIVSGSHLIWDINCKEFISVEEYSLKYKNESVCKEILTDDEDFLCPELSCLITSNHTIPIGEWIFHDWEDNNGSPAKSLER